MVHEKARETDTINSVTTETVTKLTKAIAEMEYRRIKERISISKQKRKPDSSL